MIETLLNLMLFAGAFLLAIGILVTVHEFGHYWVAKKLGIKILRFSVGFGKPLWSRRFGRDQTVFAVASVPLGGYVQMLDENEVEVDSSERHRAFNVQPLWVRTAVVLAGPMFNFLFAILAFAAMYMVGISGLKAVVGEVTPDSLAAQAGFRAEQQIIAVEGDVTPRWQSVLQATLPRVLDQEPIEFTVLDGGIERQLRLDLGDNSLDDISRGQFFDVIGMRPFQPKLSTELGRVVDGSPAAQAGLQRGDVIIAIDSQAVNDWMQLADLISEKPEKELQLTVRRGQQTLFIHVTPRLEEDGQGRLGIAPNPQLPPEYQITERYMPFTALWLGAERTWEMSILTLRVIGKMLTLQLSPKNLSGPLTIAEVAGYSVQRGLSDFLFFLGIVSLSLGIINLMPVPMLDGGHLLMYSIEAVKGKPLSEDTQLVMQKVGLFLVFALMSLALFNDFERLLS